MKFVDSILAPGVLSGSLMMLDGHLYHLDDDQWTARRVNLTVGQVEYYTKIKKLKKLEKFILSHRTKQHA